jgi:hypothetical protein
MISADGGTLCRATRAHLRETTPEERLSPNKEVNGPKDLQLKKSSMP